MWVVNFVVVRDGERSRDDGSPRFLNPSAPFPVPDIDQSVVHRGETFVVDDVVWDLERKTVFVEIAPSDEIPASAEAEIEIESDPEPEEPDGSDDDQEIDDPGPDDEG